MTALGAVAARGDVEAEVVAPNVRVEKIFHYEEGSEVTNELAERGVSLAEIWPGLYAIDFRRYGANFTVFDERGKVTREWGAGVSADGRLIAYVPSDPGDELVVAELATGDRIGHFPLNILGPKSPTITLSDDGERVCVSNSSSNSSRAGVVSEQGTVVELKSDETGSFHLSPDGNYVVFCGARTLAVFEINLASN